MRKKLASIKDERKRFTGVFSRYGVKRNFKGAMEKTLLVENIREKDTVTVLSSHVWFSYTQSFADAGFMKEGDLIEFDARVKLYTKGYVNSKLRIDQSSTDYRLSHPTKVKIV